MGVLVSSSEIIESVEEESKDRSKKHSIEDDINRLFQAIEAKGLAKDRLRRSAMKRPMKSASSGIGVAEPASLKQALRGLCISQASEMAATKRMTMMSMSKPLGSLSEAKHIKRLYRAVVVEADSSGLLMSCGEKGRFVEVSLVPEDAHVVEVASSKSCLFRNKSRVEKKTAAADTDSSRENATSASSSSEGSSSVSGSSRSGGKRPHMSRDSRWEAIHRIRRLNGGLGLSHFKLLKRLGCGDIGTVYLAELSGTSSLFALKVMDNEFLASRKKMVRAQTERDILQMLDHPFLPTLFAHFVSDKLSCLVMEYCPGGDLHVLRQKQPTRSFSEQAARFYVAEVLVALEYLHMLGVVYRDLKPENILVREDGHIMLSDFDLSLRGAAVNPTVENLLGPLVNKKMRDPSCIDPFCHVSCFAPAKLSLSPSSRAGPLPQLVAEPTGARSNSFVGTHEYLAPEIVRGEGHGSCVDWWTLGIFLFELLYGTTPFKGPAGGNEETLANVASSKSLKFPNSPTMVSFHARDLMRALLVKDPEGRLGSVKGATEIKRHPFFEGLNWALIRSTPPPKLSDSACSASSLGKQESIEQTEFVMF